MNQERSLLTRRNAIRSGAVAATGGVIGTATLLYSSQPVLAANIEAWDANQNEVSIRTTDGTIDSLIVDPTLTLEWSNFPSDSSITVDLYVETEDESAWVEVESVNVDSTSGEETLYTNYQFDAFDDDDVRDGGLDPETFAADSGETNETPFTVRVGVIPDPDELETQFAEDAVTIIVENVESELTVSGSFDTEVESDNEVNE